MSDSQPNAVEQILQSVDWASIRDERARECIRLLLNLVESLTADLRKAQAEILSLREQLKDRKGGGGKPGSPGTVRPQLGGRRKKSVPRLREPRRARKAANWTVFGSTGKQC
jgi:hypothetical protein